MRRPAAWLPPWPVTTSASFERVSSSNLDLHKCPEQIAKKARPEVWPDVEAPWVDSQKGDFPLGLARDGIVRLLSDSQSNDVELAERIREIVNDLADLTKDGWSDLSREVAARMVEGYVGVRARLIDDGQLGPSQVVPEIVAVEEEPRLEYYAWGIWHIADDGRVREFHAIRNEKADQVRMTDASVALIAYSLAHGKVMQSKPFSQWSAPFLPKDTQPSASPAHLRVRVIGVLDGSESLRFSGTIDEATQLLEEHGEAEFARLGGGTYRASRRCAGCSLRRYCRGLTNRPGLLGVTGYSNATRSITPSDISAYRQCPKRVRLERDLGLPGVRETSDAQRRGQQIHAWLEYAHARSITCTPGDLVDPSEVDLDSPLSSQHGIAHELEWTTAEYVENYPFLAAHLDFCPITESVVNARSEETVTAWDTDANIVASARIDHVRHMNDGRIVYRETKTINRKPGFTTTEQALDVYPQIALSVCLLADDPDILEGVVELEILTNGEGYLYSFDASDAHVLLAARRYLAEILDAWLHDDTHQPSEDPPCHWCPMRHVCPDSRADGKTPRQPTAVNITPSGLTDQELLQELANDAQDDDEDIPF